MNRAKLRRNRDRANTNDLWWQWERSQPSWTCLICGDERCQIPHSIQEYADAGLLGHQRKEPINEQ